MVSFLLSADIRLTAEDVNFSVNRRNAHTVSLILHNIRSSAQLLLYTNIGGSAAANTASFFAENPFAACIVVAEEDGKINIYPNMPMLSAIFVSEESIRAYIEEADFLKEVRAGRALAKNASPALGAPLAAFFFPLNQRTAKAAVVKRDAAAVIFSTTYITQSFGGGDNINILLNENAEVIAHPDLSLVLGGVNMARAPYIAGIIGEGGNEIQSLRKDENGVTYISAHQKISLNDSRGEGEVLLITLISSDVVLSGIAATTRRNLFLGFAVLALSVSLIGLFSRTLSRPLKKLTQAAQKIENGDYNFNLKADSKDEIGVLTESFIGMRYSLENFERFTNKALVKLAREQRLTRTGINRNATVCFVFIRDFENMTGGLRARTVVEFVNKFLERIVPCIMSTGGIVDKFLTQGGVVIMAHWGAADVDGSAFFNEEKWALSCVRACLMMRFALYNLNAERFEQFWHLAPPIKMGCGINSGELIAGQIGCETRMEYTVIGDTVNLASRLEGPNDVFDTDILISEKTQNLLGGAVHTAEMPSIMVKGKNKPLRVFAVLNMSTVEDSMNLFEECGRINGMEIQDAARGNMQTLASVTTIKELHAALSANSVLH
jgi:adenylate cyclase